MKVATRKFKITHVTFIILYFQWAVLHQFGLGLLFLSYPIFILFFFLGKYVAILKNICKNYRSLREFYKIHISTRTTDAVQLGERVVFLQCDMNFSGGIHFSMNYLVFPQSP